MRVCEEYGRFWCDILPPLLAHLLIFSAELQEVFTWDGREREEGEEGVCGTDDMKEGGSQREVHKDVVVMEETLAHAPRDTLVITISLFFPTHCK